MASGVGAFGGSQDRLSMAASMGGASAAFGYGGGAGAPVGGMIRILQRTDPALMQSHALFGRPNPVTGVPQGGLAEREFNFQREQWKQADARRQQMLNLLGLTPEVEKSGGLLNSRLFQDVLGNTVGGLVGDVTRGFVGGGGGGLFGGSGNISQPGFRDSPGSPGGGGGLSGGGGGGMFGDLLAARQAEGNAIMNQISQYGQSHRNRIGEEFQNLGNSALANLESRGLGSSSLAPTTQLKTEQGRQRAVGELEDQLISQQINARMQLGEGMFGDVNTEMDRGVARQGQSLGLLSSLFGSALGAI